MSILAICIIAVLLLALLVVIKIDLNRKGSHEHARLVLDVLRCQIHMLNAQSHPKLDRRFTEASMLIFGLQRLPIYDPYMRQYVSKQFATELVSLEEARDLYRQNFRGFVNELIGQAIKDRYAFLTLYWIRSELLRPHINPPHPRFRYRPEVEDGASWESVPGWRLLVRLHIKYPSEFDLHDPPESRPENPPSLKARAHNTLYITKILREFRNPDRPARIPTPVGEEYRKR